MVSLRDVQTKTPTPGEGWLKMTDDARLALVQDRVRGGFPAEKDVIVFTAKPDGQIIVGLAVPMPPGKRGPLLLDLEAFLKQSIDPGLVVWLEPLGDKNSLRNLRGIEVKS